MTHDGGAAIRRSDPSPDECCRVMCGLRIAPDAQTMECRRTSGNLRPLVQLITRVPVILMRRL